MKRIAIGSDHAGYAYKESIKVYLSKKGYPIEDVGAKSEDSVDYPDFAHAVSSKIVNHEADLGILICGTGNGVCITANKHQEIRAGLCWDAEIAKLIRQHNNANVMCLSGRFTSELTAIACVDAFVTSEFEGGRHQRRIDKIACAV